MTHRIGPCVGHCSGNATVSCNNDADCSTLGLGNCGASYGIDRKPNDCTNGICYPVVGQTDRGARSSDVAMTPDPTGPTLAATFCLQALSSGSKNSARGYPGPGSIRVETSIEPRY